MSAPTERLRSGLKPLVRCSSDDCAALRLAVAKTNHKVESIAEVLAVAPQYVYRLLDPNARRGVSSEVVDQLEAHPATRELAQWYRRFRAERAQAREQRSA